MSATELFGIAAIAAMVITYALEDGDAKFILAFGLSCLAAAIYAVLIRAWPFAAAETIWSVVAIRRWLRRK